METNNYATINQTEAHGKTSDRFGFVSTRAMLDVLADFGWHPSKVMEAGARGDNRGFQSHIVRLRNDLLKTPVVGEYHPEIVLKNSHMGTSSFKLMCGVYRLVCSNGMTVGETWRSHTVRHVGFTTEKAEGAIKLTTALLPEVIDAVESMRAISLNDSEREVFAKSAIELLKGDDNQWAIEPRRILEVRRWADRKDTSLWGTFNVVQENVIKGGYRRQNADGHYSRARAVKSIDKDLKLNQALWTLAEEMVKLKTASV